MTQKELALAYITEFGTMIPAKMAGKAYRDGYFGSETSKRCRELRNELKLSSRGKGKFTEYFLRENRPNGPVSGPTQDIVDAINLQGALESEAMGIKFLGIKPSYLATHPTDSGRKMKPLFE